MLGRWVRPMRAEPFAETPEPRGESSFFGRAGTAVTLAARAVAHVPTPGSYGKSNPAALQSRADHIEAAGAVSRIRPIYSSS